MLASEIFNFVICPTLLKLDAITCNPSGGPELPHIKYTQESLELVFVTGCTESDYKHIVQILDDGSFGKGLSFFQIEAKTHEDLYNNFLKYKPVLSKIIERNFGTTRIRNTNLLLMTDLAYSVLICRLLYFRIPEQLPKKSDPTYIADLAKYWKTHYNTKLGAGDPLKFVKKYHQYSEVFLKK